MFDGLRQRHLGVVIAVVDSSLLLAAGCLPFALTSATSGVETLADGELPDNFMMVDYSTSYTLKLGDYYDAPAGSIYLILDLEIENHGYDSFSVNPMFWSAIIDGEEYRSEVVLVGEDLEAVSVANGGTASGRVAFLVPKTAESAGFEIKYTPFLGGVQLITREI